MMSPNVSMTRVMSVLLVSDNSTIQASLDEGPLIEWPALETF